MRQGNQLGFTSQPFKKETDVLKLSGKDLEVVVDALMNPPEPNDALRKAANKERLMISSEGNVHEECNLCQLNPACQPYYPEG